MSLHFCISIQGTTSSGTNGKQESDTARKSVKAGRATGTNAASAQARGNLRKESEPGNRKKERDQLSAGKKVSHEQSVEVSEAAASKADKFSKMNGGTEDSRRNVDDASKITDKAPVGEAASDETVAAETINTNPKVVNATARTTNNSTADVNDFEWIPSVPERSSVEQSTNVNLPQIGSAPGDENWVDGPNSVATSRSGDEMVSLKVEKNETKLSENKSKVVAKKGSARRSNTGALRKSTEALDTKSRLRQQIKADDVKRDSVNRSTTVFRSRETSVPDKAITPPTDSVSMSGGKSAVDGTTSDQPSSVGKGSTPTAEEKLETGKVKKVVSGKKAERRSTRKNVNKTNDRGETIIANHLKTSSRFYNGENSARASAMNTWVPKASFNGHGAQAGNWVVKVKKTDSKIEESHAMLDVDVKPGLDATDRTTAAKSNTANDAGTSVAEAEIKVSTEGEDISDRKAEKLTKATHDQKRRSARKPKISVSPALSAGEAPGENATEQLQKAKPKKAQTRSKTLRLKMSTVNGNQHPAQKWMEKKAATKMGNTTTDTAAVAEGAESPNAPALVMKINDNHVVDNASNPSAVASMSPRASTGIDVIVETVDTSEVDKPPHIPNRGPRSATRGGISRGRGRGGESYRGGGTSSSLRGGRGRGKGRNNMKVQEMCITKDASPSPNTVVSREHCATPAG